MIANPEVTAMAGAGTSFASGANGLIINPAGLAYRPFGHATPGSLSVKLAQHHLRDTPTVASARLFALTNDGTLTEGGLAAVTQHGSVGIVGSRLSGWDGAGTHLTLDEWHVGLSRAFVDDHLLIGAGSRLLALTLDDQAGDLFGPDLTAPRFQGGGLEGGLLLADIGHGFNVGLTARSPVRAIARGAASTTASPDPAVLTTPATDTTGTTATETAAAEGAVAPWQLVVGGSWFSRTARHPRSPAVRIAVDVLLDGPVQDGIALPAGAAALPQTSGAVTTVSPRLGGEVEVLPDRLRLRAGTYLEPSRTTLNSPRLHGTGGVELRLFRLRALGFIDLDVSWRVVTDLAPGYTHLSWLGIGAWQRPIQGLPPPVSPPPVDAAPQAAAPLPG